MCSISEKPADDVVNHVNVKVNAFDTTMKGAKIASKNEVDLKVTERCGKDKCTMSLYSIFYSPGVKFHQ